MKVVIQDNRRYILRFDRGEEVIAALKQFLADQKITACAFNGLGACSDLELAYFNFSKKEYEKKIFQEDLEIVSLTGNGGNGALHMHGSFGKTDFSLIGGHISKLLVSLTCEIFLIKLEGELKRELNADLNLNLLV